LLGYFFSENTALTLTYATNVSLIVATIPIISLIITRLIGDTDHLNKTIIFGFIIAYIGVVMIVTVNGSSSNLMVTGDAIAFAAAVFFAFYSYVLVKVNGKYNIIHLTRNIFYYMTLLLFIYNLSSGTFTIEYYPVTKKFEIKMFLSLLFLGIIASSFSFLMWNQSIKLIGNIRTSQYIYFGPIVTTAFASVILNEPITYVTVTGTLMIIGGVYLAELKSK
jgi:drug/metabolite transporter (DMT)-like permease